MYFFLIVIFFNCNFFNCNSFLIVISLIVILFLYFLGGIGECIQYNDEWFTPNKFEQLAGSKARKYKMSIRSAANGSPIGEYIAKGYLVEGKN